jgi:hypothetical protein
MYFNFLPAIKYDQKPISYPFSESDYVVAKNFFRRYKISDTAFTQSTYFNKYALQDGQRLDQIAEAVYDNAFYDWVIILTNNMVNTQFDLPMSESELRKHVESQYDNPYYDYHHYEIISDDEQIENFGKVLIPGKTVVDESFYNNQKTLTVGTLPDLSSTTKTDNYSKNYTFSSNGFDNSFVVNSQNANFETYGTGLGTDGGFVIYSPIRNGVRSDGYLRFRGIGERFAEFYPVDATNLDQFVFKGKFGTGNNGGEQPDLEEEILKLQYKLDPSSAWVDIDTIIPVRMIQYFDYNGTAQPDVGFGGPNRPAGQYNNVSVYLNDGTTETNARVNVTVESDGSISAVDIVDRGELIPNITSAIIRNVDIGNGYLYIDALQTIEYLPDLLLFNVSVFEAPDGTQYNRYSNVPFEFSLDIPTEAKTSSTQFRLYQESNSGEVYDQFAIQQIEYRYSITYVVETPLDYIQIDNDNYVIDGVRWTRINSAWYKVTQIGYRYHDNGTTNEISGSELSRPVTEFEYEQTENEKKREIYILKPNYVTLLVDDFRKAALYKKSSDYVSNRLKKTGI